jgi:hypothetical protein
MIGAGRKRAELVGIRESVKKKLFWGVIIHDSLLWAALALGYNSYKEFMRDFEPLSMAVRDSIKATFPWAILIFSSLYFIFSIRRKIGGIFLTTWQYLYIIIFYAILLNLIFFSKGRDVLIPINLTIVYFVILLLTGIVLTRYVNNIENLVKAQDWLPPIIYRFLTSKLPRAQAYIKEKPSAPFIIAFMALLVICAFLLIFKSEKAAEHVANIAYFSLVIGVGIEIYHTIKHGEHDTGDDEQ